MKSNNNTKQLIIDTTIKLITKQGVKNTSLADIARNTNISKGTLYYYYASKDDIISEIADVHLNIINEAVLMCVKNINGTSDLDLVSLVMDNISTISSTGRIHMYLICEAITENENLRNQFKEKYRAWRLALKNSLIENLSEEHKDRADAISFLLISIVDGLVMQSILKSEEIPFADISKCLVDIWN
ncbi:TetR/AcrR family transcriptional regulator [Peptacetobacter sp.]|uniref:TetR/AcrR family transcriptional regulator n=1 Tax=Peptacetobacter sp. TaxID=2991975 RepID=UPI00263094E1|nr:TetR/AcrR family transcriptional regulator [Peptacetobacter sp.]